MIFCCSLWQWKLSSDSSRGLRSELHFIDRCSCLSQMRWTWWNVLFWSSRRSNGWNEENYQHSLMEDKDFQEGLVLKLLSSFTLSFVLLIYCQSFTNFIIISVLIYLLLCVFIVFLNKFLILDVFCYTFVSKKCLVLYEQSWTVLLVMSVPSHEYRSVWVYEVWDTKNCDSTELLLLET